MVSEAEEMSREEGYLTEILEVILAIVMICGIFGLGYFTGIITK